MASANKVEFQKHFL